MPGLVLSCLVLALLCFGLAWLGLAGRLELERFVSFSCLFPELSGSISGKAEKTCETQHQPVALLGR